MNRRTFIRDAATGLFVLGAPAIARAAQLPFRRNAFRGGGVTPIALVAHVSKQGTSGGSGNSAGINTAGASLLVMVLNDYTGSASATPSDSNGNTWVLAKSQAGGPTDGRVNIYYVANPITGAGHTFAATGTTTFASLAVTAWSSTHATPLDQTNSAFTGSVADRDTGSVTPTSNNQLLIAAVNPYLGTGVSINSSFSISDSHDIIASNSWGIGSAYLVQTTAGAANPLWSWSGGSQPATAAIATFKHA